MGEGAVLTWSEFDTKLYQWELANKEKRITHIYFKGTGAPPSFDGAWSACPISRSKTTRIRLSSGDYLDYSEI